MPCPVSETTQEIILYILPQYLEEGVCGLHRIVDLHVVLHNCVTKDKNLTDATIKAVGE